MRHVLVTRRRWYQLDIFSALERLYAYLREFVDLDPARLMSDRPRTAKPELHSLEPRALLDGRPVALPVIFAGSGSGMTPYVSAYAADTGDFKFSEEVYANSFTGGVRVAAADFTHDGYPDLVVGPGPGGGPNVKVIDGKSSDPIDGPLGSFWAFDPTFDGGVNVATGDVDGDGVADVIVAAGPGGGPRVKVFSGSDGSVIADFFALEPNFRGGISVAASDLNGDGKAEVIVGAGAGGGPRVMVMDPLTAQPIAGPLGSFFAFDQSFRGGVYVGASNLAGDVDHDGTPDIAVGSGSGMTAEAKVYSGATGDVLQDIEPFGSFTGGVRVALAYVDDDVHADLIAGTGDGTAATIRVFSGADGKQLASPLGEYTPFGSSTGGVFVGASNDPATIDASVFLDANSNGTQDIMEMSAGSGITVTLSLGGVLVASGTTNSSSFAEFTGLTTNTDYQIDAVAGLPAGYTDEGPVTVNSGSSFPAFGHIGLAPIIPVVITGINDDTGASNADRLTNDTSLTFHGTAPAKSTVSLSDRYTTGTDTTTALGTATASSGGLWTLTYASALAEGTHNVTASGSGQTASPYQVNIDTTAPTVVTALDPAASSYSTVPQVLVTASDLWGFGGTTTVTLDVDLNNDGDYSDPGETGYATTAMTFGSATFSGYSALSVGTVKMRARMSDAAGNEGTSSSLTVTVSSAPNSWTLTDGTPSSLSSYGGANGTASNSLLNAGDVTISQSLGLSINPAKPSSAVIYDSAEASRHRSLKASSSPTTPWACRRRCSPH